MNYVLLGLTILFAVANNIFLHRLNEKEEKCNVFLFNALVSFVWFVVLFILGKGLKPVSMYTVLFGMLFGALTALFLLFKMLALGNGPVSVASLIGCCSLIIPTLCGTIIWKEHINASQIIGMVLLFLSLYFVVNPKVNAKINRKFIVYSCLFFVCAGMNGLVMIAYSKMGESAELNDMMVIASFLAFAILLLIYASSRMVLAEQKRSPLEAENRKAVIRRSSKYVLLCGMTSCVYQRLNLYLTGELASIVFFPIFNGMVIFLSCVAGIWFFKEKMTKKQIIGILTGTLSIMLVGNIICF